MFMCGIKFPRKFLSMSNETHSSIFLQPHPKTKLQFPHNDIMFGLHYLTIIYTTLHLVFLQ